MARLLELTTQETLAAGGDAVARAPEGREVFIAGVAPRERVEVELIQVNKRFCRARVRKILSPGPSRTKPDCAHYGHCGGCALQRE